MDCLLKMVSHLEFLVEEPSLEAFLRQVLPSMLHEELSFEIYTYRGKYDLLRKLPSRLAGYSKWIPEDWRIFVLVDRDDDNCLELKSSLEGMAASVGLMTPSTGGETWSVSFRILIEELEAWYFGEWSAVKKAYPSVPDSIPKRASYRDPDGIVGGTWEAFERVLQASGYFIAGLQKVSAANEVARNFDPQACSSPSFVQFRALLQKAVADGQA